MYQPFSGKVQTRKASDMIFHNVNKNHGKPIMTSTNRKAAVMMLELIIEFFSMYVKPNTLYK